jgi:predicted membrane GTPase involved in stress response
MDCLQIATVEVPEEHMGHVVELLGKRRGQMFDMQGVGCVTFSFHIFSSSIFCNFPIFNGTFHNL